MGAHEEDDQKTPRPPPGGRSTTAWTATVAAAELAEVWLLVGNDDEPSTWLVKGFVVLVQLVRALAGKQ